MDTIFSLQQLQEKCEEQNLPLYIVFIGLTKAFKLVSRDGLFKALVKSGYRLKLHSLVESVLFNMNKTVGSMEIFLSPLTSAAELAKAVSLLQPFLGFSLLFGTSQVHSTVWL